EDHRVTGGQHRADLPSGHEQREIPRHNRTDDTHGLACNQGKGVRACGRDLVIDLVDRFRIPTDAVRATGYIDTETVPNGLAHIERLQQRQLLTMFVDEIGEALQHLLALLGSLARPATLAESGTRRGD